MEIFSDWAKRLTSYFTGFSDKFSYIADNSTALIGLIGLAIIIIALIKFKKIKLNANIIARVGLALALACVLQVFRIYHFPMGGSVTLGGMVPLLLIAFIYGPEVGMLAGFLYGVLNLFLDPYFIHPVQVLFDYPLPSLAIGLAGYFKNKPVTGTIVAFSTKFVCHFISGIVFFASSAVEANMNPWIYSLIVNGPMVACDAVICIVIITILPLAKLIKTTTLERA